MLVASCLSPQNTGLTANQALATTTEDDRLAHGALTNAELECWNVSCNTFLTPMGIGNCLFTPRAVESPFVALARQTTALLTGRRCQTSLRGVAGEFCSGFGTFIPR